MIRNVLSRFVSSSGLGALTSSSSSGGARAAAPPLVAAAAQQRRALTASSAAAAAELVASTAAERAIAEKIAGGLAGARSVRVEDTSGGCGTMYAIEVVASEFSGATSKIKQHQLVAKLIADDVKQWHGFQLVTKAP